ncbi:MAG TPA: helix-turn-helix transcriptional regulator, partial [Sphingomonas sp.]
MSIVVLQERIAAKLAELNVSAREISMAAVKQPDAIRNILKKNAMPAVDRLDAIAAELGTTADWLLGRHGAAERSDPVEPPVSEAMFR